MDERVSDSPPAKRVAGGGRKRPSPPTPQEGRPPTANAVAMWCTLIEMSNACTSATTMYHTGVPDELKAEHGSTQGVANAAASAIEAMANLDRAAYERAIQLVGKPRFFPLVCEGDEFLSDESGED